MFPEINFQYVDGHIEVYDRGGNFLFSADNIQEAMHELEDTAA